MNRIELSSRFRDRARFQPEDRFGLSAVFSAGNWTLNLSACPRYCFLRQESVDIQFIACRYKDFSASNCRHRKLQGESRSVARTSSLRTVIEFGGDVGRVVSVQHQGAAARRSILVVVRVVRVPDNPIRVAVGRKRRSGAVLSVDGRRRRCGTGRHQASAGAPTEGVQHVVTAVIVDRAIPVHRRREDIVVLLRAGVNRLDNVVLAG
jgi:hypothetical protein